MHDARDEAGMYRPLTSAEVRRQRAREETQTHSGKFTHERDASERRRSIAVNQYSAPLFTNKRVTRKTHEAL